MIEVEKVNGQPVLLNPDLIKLIEKAPDTVVTFSDGQKMLLKTTPEEIVQRIIEYRRRYSMPEVK
jgi:flagellar protein FlbD